MLHTHIYLCYIDHVALFKGLTIRLYVDRHITRSFLKGRNGVAINYAKYLSCRYIQRRFNTPYALLSVNSVICIDRVV